MRHIYDSNGIFPNRSSHRQFFHMQCKSDASLAALNMSFSPILWIHFSWMWKTKSICVNLSPLIHSFACPSAWKKVCHLHTSLLSIKTGEKNYEQNFEGRINFNQVDNDKKGLSSKWCFRWLSFNYISISSRQAAD